MKIIYERNLIEMLSNAVDVTDRVKHTYNTIKVDYTSKGEESLSEKIWKKFGNKYFKDLGINCSSDLGEFNLGESAWGPSPKVKEFLNSFDPHSLLLYPDPNSTKLMKTISSIFSLEGYVFEKKNGESFLKYPITMGSGSNEILERITRMFVRPGSKVAVHNPTFFRFEEAAAHANATVISSNLKEENGFAWTKKNTDTYLDWIDNDECDLYWLCTPNNPTSTVIPLSEIEKIVNAASEKKKLVVVDEAYGEFIEKNSSKKDTSATQLSDDYDNLLVVRTVSKGLGLAGIRTGYAIGSPEVIEILEKTRLQFPVSIISQELANIALQDLKYMDDVKISTKDARKRLVSELENKYHVYPSETNILVLRGKENDCLADYFASKGIMVQDLGFIKGLEGYIRLTVKTEVENQYLIERI